MTDATTTGPTTTGARLTFSPLSEQEARRAHEVALAALARGGVRVGGERALDVLAGAGAAVDRAAGSARLPEALVSGAVAQAPATFTLAGRAPGHDVTLGVGPAGLVAATAAADDVAAAARLADALPEVAAIGLPTRRLAELPDVLDATTKPVLVCGQLSSAAAAVVVEAAAALAGSAGEARARPPLAVLVHTSAQDDLDPLLACAEAGVPCGFLTGPLAGPDAAEAGAAACTAVHAAALAAAALQQLAAPGSAYVVPALPSAVEWHAPGHGAGPEAARSIAAVAQLAAAAGLPVTTGLPPERPAADEWRAALAGHLATLTTTLSPNGLLAGAGQVGDGAVWSAAQLVLDAETWSMCARIAAGIAVDDETIALETIEAIGIGGNALGQRHTRRHMKEVWRPRLFDRASYDVWHREGRKGAAERAAALAAELSAAHEVPPLEAEKRSTLRRIIATAGL